MLNKYLVSQFVFSKVGNIAFSSNDLRQPFEKTTKRQTNVYAANVIYMLSNFAIRVLLIGLNEIQCATRATLSTVLYDASGAAAIDNVWKCQCGLFSYVKCRFPEGIRDNNVSFTVSFSFLHAFNLLRKRHRLSLRCVVV